MTTQTSELLNKAEAARAASRVLRGLSTAAKDLALERIADTLERQVDVLLQANAFDMEAGRRKGLGSALLARLELTSQSLTAIADGVRKVAGLPDPVGEEFEVRRLPNGIRLSRRRVPLGVIGTIFEARPEVPADISALCIKSGNAVVLRGGSDAAHTNQALGRAIRESLVQTDVPLGAVQVIESQDRSIVQQMLRLDKHIDLLIPRGGAELVNLVAREATMPVVTGGVGVCHTYVDSSADIAMAVEIAVNAKTQAPAKCNALDTLLVHVEVAPALLPDLAGRLIDAGVELRCDRRALPLVGVSRGSVIPATGGDWGREFLAPVLAVRLVDSVHEAICHIETHGSGHTEAIVTEDYARAAQFVDEVDAAVVLVNASTRFNDGGQMGLGAEVAISTNKLHARGPMGLRELTSYKWVALGSGQTRP